MSSNNPLSNIPPLGPPSGMTPPPGQGKFKPVDPMKILRQYWILFAITAVFAAGAGLGTWYLLDKYMPRYTSEAQLAVNKGLGSGAEAQTSEVNIRELEPEIQNNVQRIRSEDLLLDLLKSQQVARTDWFAKFQDNKSEAVKDLLEKGTLRANHQTNTTLIRLAVKTAEKEDAQTILKELIRVYLDRVQSDRGRQNQVDRAAFIAQRNEASQRIQELDDQIGAFRERNQVGSTNDRTATVNQELSFKMQYRDEMQRYLASASANYQTLLQRQEQQDFEPSAIEIYQIEMSRQIVEIDMQIRNLKVERESLTDQGIAENNAAIRRFDTKIRSLQAQREIEFNNQARFIFNQSLEAATQQVAEFGSELESVESEIGELQARVRDLQRNQERLESFQREMAAQEEIRNNANQLLYDLDARISRNVTVSLYTLPTQAEKTFPKIEVIAPAVTVLLLGLVVGLVFLRELLDQRLKGPGDIKAIPDATMLGIIPHASEDQSGNIPVEDVVKSHPGSLLAESFRQLRTSILSKMDRRGYKTLMLVGAKPQSGVSTLTHNLATSMALSGRRVLILDANFRRSTQAELFGLGRGGPGLADLLSGQIDLDQTESVIHHDDRTKLSLLAAGSQEALTPELFETPAFRELLSRLETNYDLIIVDVAPLLLATEANLLAKHVDATMIVCRAMSDTRGMMTKMLGELDGQRADILGIVLNSVRSAAGGYMRKNFREFYQYREPNRSTSSRSNRSGKKSASRSTAAASAQSASDTGRAVPQPTNGKSVHADDNNDALDFDFEDEDDRNGG